MDIFSLFMISIGLAMDAFAVSVTNGISVSRFNTKDAFKMSTYFGFFQFLMPLIGYALGISISGYIKSFDHWIAFFLLCAIGINMIKESFDKDCEKDIKKQLTNKLLFLQAIATSIDALAVGISLALLDINIIFSSCVIGIVAFVFSFVGGKLGKKMSCFLKSKAELAGGIILILLGLKILIEHLFLS